MYFGFGVGLRAEEGVGILAVKLFLDKAENSCDGEGHNEIQNADYKIGLEGLEILTLDDAREIVKLRNTDNIEHRGVLDVNNKLVADGGEP